MYEDEWCDFNCNINRVKQIFKCRTNRSTSVRITTIKCTTTIYKTFIKKQIVQQQQQQQAEYLLMLTNILKG